MAFKLGSDTLLDSNQDGRLENLYIDGTLVLDGDDQGNVTLKNVIFDASLNVGQGTLDTDDVTEGTNNLYFTDARAQLALSGDIATLAADITTGDANTLLSVQSLISASETSVLSTAQTYDASILSQAQAYADSVVSTGTGNLTTDDIPEASNLYYTDTRVNTYLTNNSFTNETYVDNAESNAILVANAYTDARETAITTANEAYADQAELDAISTANAYTDARETAITTAYEAYADQAEADAITTANAYTDARETAITTAYQAYTDTSVANLVDAAPGTLDTLNELASALGDDPSFATTIANDIGTKVSKSGDTMTGALTLSGAPTNSNHATTKAYVDSSIPTVPTNISAFTNDAGYLTSVGSISYNDLTDTPTIPTVPTNVSSFTNDAGYLTSVGSISYNDLTDTPTIPTVPTNVSSFTNDAGYITSYTDTNTTYSDGDGIGLTGTTFYVAAGNGLTQNGNGLAMSGSYTGTFTASGDVCAYSDRALKRNIKTIEGALDKVTEMRGVTFLKDGKASTGVIAQEIETVLPEVVNQDSYGMRSVAYGNIVGTLIEAIKEQQVQIEKLQSEIAKIKKK